MQNKIRDAALEVFHDKGFHGASIREIAEKAGCSLPTLYYYYHDKRKMFEDILSAEYEALNEKIFKSLENNKKIEDFLFESIRLKKGLSLRDRLIYKMSIKVWLNFEDFPNLRNKVLEIDRVNVERIIQRYQDYFQGRKEGMIIGSLIIRTISDLTLKIILFEEDIPDQQIRQEFDYLVKK
jgi:AcrR family transcriptional regulator